MPFIATKIVTRHCEAVEMGNNGPTIGQRIDEIISTSLDKGDELHEVTFGFEGEEWGAFYRQYREGLAPRQEGETRRVK